VQKKTDCTFREPLHICVFCRHWDPIYIGEIGTPEDPGSCTGQVGKWANLNGMWMKAADSCDRWALSPARAKQAFDWMPAALPEESQKESQG